MLYMSCRADASFRPKCTTARIATARIATARIATARIATARQKHWKMSTARIKKSWKSGTCTAVQLKKLKSLEHVQQFG